MAGRAAADSTFVRQGGAPTLTVFFSAFQSTFNGQPVLLRDAGISKIRWLAPLTLPQKFLGLSDQRFPNATVSNS